MTGENIPVRIKTIPISTQYVPEVWEKARQACQDMHRTGPVVRIDLRPIRLEEKKYENIFHFHMPNPKVRDKLEKCFFSQN